MKAYAHYGPYVNNWKSKDWILGTVKGAQNLDFTYLGPGRRDKWENIPLGQALYLYGGRGALLNQLGTTTTYAWDAGSAGQWGQSMLFVYQGTVKAKLKVKQIIVITAGLLSGAPQHIQTATAAQGNNGVYVTMRPKILVAEIKDLITKLLDDDQ